MQIEVLIEEAEAGNPQSQCALGFAYISGRGVARDAERARHWYLLAARAGHTGAQYNLADIYLRGDGIEPDLNQAIHWFEQAAIAGDPDALYNLGLIYQGRLDRGKSVVADAKKAFGYFLEAAERGLARAQFETAVMYLEGQGVEESSAKARFWLEKAASNGVARAEELLEEI
ncbi:sel1 repeat family protein [bacterium]|nr:sel1 repeat family protein [bacterium]